MWEGFRVLEYKISLHHPISDFTIKLFFLRKGKTANSESANFFLSIFAILPFTLHLALLSFRVFLNRLSRYYTKSKITYGLIIFNRNFAILHFAFLPFVLKNYATQFSLS